MEHRMTRVGVVLSIGVLNLVGSLAAQGIPVELLPPVGSVVRAEYRTLTGTDQVRGELLSFTTDRIVLARGRADRYELSDGSLLGLDVSEGRDHGQGAVLGLGIGALGGALLFGALMGASGSGGDCMVCSPTAGAAYGVTVGAPLGFLIGLLVGREQWRVLW